MHGQHGQHHHQSQGGGGGYLPDISVSALERYQVLPMADELYQSSIYDSAPYPAAGITAIPYFSNQQGQAGGIGGGNKTYTDTNLDMPSQLSQGTGFLVEQIEVEFQPARPTPANVKDMPAFFGAGQTHQLINDIYVFGCSGFLEFKGPNNKTFILDGPMNRFPSSRNFNSSVAFSDATTLAAAQQSRAGFAHWSGQPFNLHPVPIYLDPSMKFGVTLNFPEAPTLPSGVAARVYVRLLGIRVHLGSGRHPLARRAQQQRAHQGGGHQGGHHHLQYR